MSRVNDKFRPKAGPNFRTFQFDKMINSPNGSKNDAAAGPKILGIFSVSRGKTVIFFDFFGFPPGAAGWPKILYFSIRQNDNSTK